ncbi:MAG: Crp/Fnr family transcriptional regulator [Pseudomonas sp.]
MSKQLAKAPVNQLLDKLPVAEQSLILSHGKEVKLSFGDILSLEGKSHASAYFPLTGMISLVTNVDESAPLEMGMIGNEGLLGATLVLGVDEAPLRAVVQAKGSALRIPAAALQDLLQDCPVLTRRLNHYLYVLMSQLNSAAGCRHFHPVSERLVRWLLMTDDRIATHSMHLTQQFLADMLGVQRSAVSIAAGALQASNLISYSRGKIKVLNRKGLENAACSCYSGIVKIQKAYRPEEALVAQQTRR